MCRLIKLALALATAGAALVAWRFSELFHRDVLLPPTDYVPQFDDGVVASVEDDRIVLDVAPDALPAIVTEGLYGIRWPGGRGRLGEILDRPGSSVVRRFEPVEGRPSVGVPVAVDCFVYYGDPGVDLGIEFSDVSIDTELGPVPAWFVEGVSTTWVIFTHGKGVERTEALRALGPVQAAGHPALLISYRNDVGNPRDPSGIHRFGATEWRDLESAVRWAIDQGAERVVLTGYSMGGAITMAFMRRSPLADRVAGIIMDAPLLDLGRAVERGAAVLGIPPVLASIAKAIAAWRFGLDWQALNHLRALDVLDVPVLLFHGRDDQRVPVELSEELAAARPDLVTYIPVDRAGHVEAWNVDRDRYVRALVEFLQSVGGGGD